MGRAGAGAGWVVWGWSVVFAGLLVIPSPASAGIALVQDVFVQSPASTDETTRTATFSSNITAGNVLIATITASTGTTLSSVTGGGVAWTQAVTAQVPSGQRIWIYYGTASAGSTNTVTVEGSSGRWTLEVGEWAGIDNSSPLDGTNSLTGNGVAPDTGNVTTTSASALLISVESDASVGPTTANTTNNFTPLANNGGAFNAQIHFPSYRIVSVTGTYSNGWLTCGSCGSVNWAAAIAAFRADASEMSYQGSGAINNTTATNPACTLPASIQANDIGIWHVQSKDNNAHTYPGDWNKVTQVNQGGSLTHSWAWKRFAGGESGTQTVTISGTNLKQCRIYLIRGVRTSGNPHEAAVTAQNTTGTIDPAAVSVTNVGALALALMAVGDDNTVIGPWSNTVGLNFYGGASGGMIFEDKTPTGTDGNLAFAFGRVTATSGFPVSVDFGSRGMLASDPWITYTIALVPGCPIVSEASYVVGNARSGQSTVYWSSTNSVVILRKAGSTFAASDIPRNTQSYSAGATIGGATVTYDGTTAASGTTCSGSSCTDTGLTNGTTYYYMVLSKNASACYSSGVEINTRPAASSPNWSYATTAATMAPVALDPWSDRIVAGSNDDKVHGKSAADGTLAFAPFIAGGPIQSRPTTIPEDFSTYDTLTGLAYWRFDEATGSVAADASGNGNTGTLVNGPVWTAGIRAGALSFNGTNQYVSVPHTSALNAYPLTVAAWIKTSSAPSSTQFPAIVNKYVSSSSNGWNLFTNNGNVCAFYQRNSTNRIHNGTNCTLSAGVNVFDNAWHHVAFVVDSSGGKMYVDGILRASQGWTGTAGAPTTTQGVSIGFYPSSSSPYFPGVIDEVRLYNRALTAGEILNLYGGHNIAYVSSQDGYLYAVNTSTGAQVWKACLNPLTTCDPLGNMLQGGAAVWLQALAPLTFTGGVTGDVVFVGTRNTGTGSDTNNKVYAINGTTGTIVWTFAPGTMDIISSTPYVDHARGTVWVTSRSKGGTQSSLWKLDAATGALASGTSTWSFGDIDSSPMMSADGTLLYVGTNGGELKAVRVVDRDSQLAGTSVSHTPASGAGGVRGMPWWLSWNPVGVATPDTIIFVRNLTVHSVDFNGTAFSANWTQTLTWTPSSPVDDAAGNLYFGGSDGKVHRLSVSTGTDLAQVPSTAISGTLGEPSINWDRGVIHVGGSDGHIYTFPVGF